MYEYVSAVGSCIEDLVIKVDRPPVLGESLLGSGFEMHLGGKGFNQAISLARLGLNVEFISSLGDDIYADKFIEFFKSEGINTNYIKITNTSYTGVAFIQIYPDGSNSIVVDPGAAMVYQADLSPRYLESISKSKALQIHLEIPADTVSECILKASKNSIPVFLNPAPVNEFDKKLLKHVDFLVPNETEVEALIGEVGHEIEEIAINAKQLLSLGPKYVIITLGSRGSVVASSEGCYHVGTFFANSIDSTGAGDAFCGGLMYSILTKNRILDAVAFASACGALATEKIGANSGIPRLTDVIKFMKNKKVSIKEV